MEKEIVEPVFFKVGLDPQKALLFIAGSNQVTASMKETEVAGRDGIQVLAARLRPLSFPTSPKPDISTARSRTGPSDQGKKNAMRILSMVFLSLSFSAALHAQTSLMSEEKTPFRLNSGFRHALYTETAAMSHHLEVNMTGFQFQDTMKFNMYGDLRNDNPLYVKKTPLWLTAVRVGLTDASTLLIDRYILKFDFSRVGFNSWKYNLQKGWEWDNDRFGMNYFFHPFSGGMYFNAARANGYSFYESAPFAVLGSLGWEYFGETTRPSYNDLINTPVNGIFLGEILYRLGSNLLDDQTTGSARFFRELAVGIMTPTRFFSRLLNGQLTRVTTEEVYQKEPLNLTFSAGYHRVNDNISELEGSNSVNFNLHLDYGNPFEKRSRKPYDFFKVRTDFDFGVGRKIIDNITGFGLLFGHNLQTGNLEMLPGFFQQMDYFDNKTFELGTISFGPGIITKLPLGKGTNLYTAIHVDLVPFGGLSNRFGPIDTTQTRDYDYAGGAEAKCESTLNLGGWTNLTFIAYYWWFHTFVGVAGNNYVAIIKPMITFNIINNISIGFEHLVYYSDRYPRDFASVHSVRTEERVFFQIYVEEFKFKR